MRVENEEKLIELFNSLDQVSFSNLNKKMKNLIVEKSERF